MTTLLSFLQNVLGTYKEHGKGELYFTCPFCHNQKQKFAININTLRWHCWQCEAKGKSLLTLFHRLDLSREQIRQLKSFVSDHDVAYYKKYNKETIADIRLPDEFCPLSTPKSSFQYNTAMRYLIKDRGLTSNDILRYNIGFCETGEYSGRIIIPSYDETGKLNYFTGRSFYPYINFRYKNPKVSKNIIGFGNLINFSLPVTLCEGVFDAMHIRYNAIPIFGKHLPSVLLDKLIKEQVKEVYICLDQDAQIFAVSMAMKLQHLGISTKNVIIAGQDAGESSLSDIWKAFHTSVTPNFKDLITQKITTGHYAHNTKSFKDSSYIGHSSSFSKTS